MSFLPDRRPAAPQSRAVSRVAHAVEAAEASVVVREAEVWAQRECTRIDVEARGALARHAFEQDVRTYDEGMRIANGSPVLVELLLRHLEDQNSDNRAAVRR